LKVDFNLSHLVHKDKLEEFIMVPVVKWQPSDLIRDNHI
jgi:hypothetical protein